MPTVDLERLRATGTYFVPIKRGELRNRILAELNVILPQLSDLGAWVIEEHGNCMIFNVSYEYLYVVNKIKFSVPDVVRNVGKLRAEYSKLSGIQIIPESLEMTRRGLPIELNVIIRRCEENGCEIEVECTPVLYRHFTQLRERNVNEYEMQDAYISCERFLRTIFIGGLSGTLLSEKKNILRKSDSEFLMNDVSHRQVTEKLEEMLNNATAEILIFGWIGTIFMKKLQELKEKSVRIRLITGNIKAIRQDEMRKEKEKAMDELVSMIGKDNISSKPEFHGRAVIVDNKALVGSMDLDSYSMTGARIEFAMYTEDPEIVRNLRSYFERIFTPWKGEVEDKSKA